MYQLAFIEVVGGDGKERKLPAADVADVLQSPTGSKVTMRDGRVVELKSTADEVYSAINTQWTAYLTALGNP